MYEKDKTCLEAGDIHYHVIGKAGKLGKAFIAKPEVLRCTLGTHMVKEENQNS